MCLLTNRYIKHIVSPENTNVLQNLHYDIKLDIASVFKCWIMEVGCISIT